MKATIFDIKRFAVHDGPGIRTTVFFKGCPLSCLWCHNPESINPEMEMVSKTVKVGDKVFTEQEQVGRELTVEELMNEILADRVFMEESNGGVSFSGGEPLMQYSVLKEVLKRCKEEGLHTVVDTSGLISKSKLMKVAGFTELFLYDLKVMDDKRHKQYTGVSNKQILKNLVALSKREVSVRIRIPLIPGYTATEDNIDAITAFLQKLPNPPSGIDLLTYHNIAGHKYERFGIKNDLKEIPSMSEDDVSPIKEQFERAGFVVSVGG